MNSKNLISEADILGNTVMQDSIAKYKSIQSSLSTLYQTAENTSVSAIETLSRDIWSTSYDFSENSMKQIYLPRNGFCNSVLARITLRPKGSETITNCYMPQGWALKVFRQIIPKIGSVAQYSILDPVLQFMAMYCETMVKEKRDEYLEIMGREIRGDAITSNNQLVAYLPIKLPFTSYCGTQYHPKPIAIDQFTNAPYLEVTTNSYYDFIFGPQTEIVKFDTMRIDFKFRMTEPVDQGVMVSNQLVKQMGSFGNYKALNYFYTDYVCKRQDNVVLSKNTNPGMPNQYNSVTVSFDFDVAADIMYMIFPIYAQMGKTGPYMVNQPLTVLNIRVAAFTGDNKYIQQNLSYIPTQNDLSLGSTSVTTRVYDDPSIYDSTAPGSYPYVTAPFLSTEQLVYLPRWQVSMLDQTQSDEIQNVPLLKTSNMTVEFIIHKPDNFPDNIWVTMFAVCNVLKDMVTLPSGQSFVAT